VSIPSVKEGLARKPEDADQWVIQARWLCTARQCQIDLMRDLGGEFVIRQRRDQTDDPGGYFQGDRHQSGAAQGRQVGDPV
jgi:hypothetical protein